MTRVQVVEDKCRDLAALITFLQPPEDQEENDFDLSTLPPAVRADFLLTTVAICHQTTPLGGTPLCGHIEGRPRAGWDYLLHAFLHAAASDPDLVTPHRLSTLRGYDLDQIMREPDPTAILTDLEGRAHLLNDLGTWLRRHAFESVDDLYEQSESFLLRPDGNGVLQLLSSACAYRDPLRKKSLFFCALTRNKRLWTFKDLANLGPPVDYHEIRGHLRLGSIRISDERLLANVRRGDLTEGDDIEIRQAVYDAIMMVADLSHRTAPALHYYFWNIFRSCCTRSDPHCDSCPQFCPRPARYRTNEQVRRCSFAEICGSRRLVEKLTDYTLLGDYY